MKKPTPEELLCHLHEVIASEGLTLEGFLRDLIIAKEYPLTKMSETYVETFKDLLSQTPINSALYQEVYIPLMKHLGEWQDGKTESH